MRSSFRSRAHSQSLDDRRLIWIRYSLVDGERCFHRRLVWICSLDEWNTISIGY